MDQYLFQQINNLAGKSVFLDRMAIFFAEYFGYILIVILLLLLAKDWKKYWQMVVLAFGSAIISRFVLTEILRWFWFRPRPFVEHKVNLLFEYPGVASFPSGHAAFYFALSALIYFYNKKTGLFFLGASFLISISRIFCGVHWPSDIITGALVGVFSGWLIWKLFKRRH